MSKKGKIEQTRVKGIIDKDYATYVSLSWITSETGVFEGEIRMD
jgi:hypothetical protein